MKLLAAIPFVLIVGLTMLPVVLAGGDAEPLPTCGIAGGPIEIILATVRAVESGSDYTATSAGSTASGAYQFIDRTWDHYGGFPHAADAPPAIQDAKAGEQVVAILADHHQDVSAVPVVWYLGHLPDPGSPTWDTVPAPHAGNRLTPRQYQTRWLDTYRQLLAARRAPEATESTSPTPGGCLGSSIEPLAGGWSLPGPVALLDENPRALGQPHHDYPAWDWLVPMHTPVYAVRAGTVTSVRTWRSNWYDAGCTADGAGCDTCGIGLTITDADGNRWTYCHGSELTTTAGTAITAGNQIMWSGNTGRSGAAHIHLEIRTPDGIRRCPQPLVTTLYRDHTGVDPASLPSKGCIF